MLNTQLFAAEVESRSKYQRDEHPLITRLVVLRIALNHEFGHAFSEYDHALAEIERDLDFALDPRNND